MNYFFLVVTVGITGYVWMRLAAARRTESSEESERDAFRRRIAQDPRNIGAHEALGDSLRRAGRIAEARDSYLRALDASGEDLILETVRYKIQQIDDDLRARAQGGRAAPTAQELQFCPRCAAPNPPQRRHCELCGGLLLLPSFWDALRDKEVLRSSLEGICIFVIIIALVRLLYFLPLEIQGAILMATAIVIGWWILRSIEGRRG